MPDPFKGAGIIDEYSLNIFTDGSSYPDKSRAAGVGVRLVWVSEEGNEVVADYFPPGWQKATIDEMEIKACTVGLQEAQATFSDFDRFKKIIIYTDSRYVESNYFKAMNIWPKTKWQLSNGMPAANINLWRELKREVDKLPIRIEVEWVKAHKSNLHNRAVDKLAKKSALLPVNKPISRSQTTKKWSDRKTVKGCIAMEGQELKIRIISRDYIPKAKTTKYRYEVIDPKSKHFKNIDFIFCPEDLSRNHCYLVKVNEDQKKPQIEEVINELQIADYKYTHG